MAIYERAQKSLDSTFNNSSIAVKISNRFYWQQGCCSINLNKKGHSMKNDTSKSTMFVISMGFLILCLIFSWQWAVITSLIAGLIGIISDTISKIIEKGWMKLARILSYIIPSILLGIVFYLFLFPISLISKILPKTT